MSANGDHVGRECVSPRTDSVRDGFGGAFVKERELDTKVKAVMALSTSTKDLMLVAD